MRILDRYILRQHMGPFLFGLATFTTIFVGTDVLYMLASLMIDYEPPLNMLVRIFFLSIPEVLVMTLPMGVLMSIILTFGRLSREGEISAFRAGGVSFKRLMMPVLLACLLISGLNILFNETIVPAAQERARELIYYARHEREMPRTQRNLYIAPVDSRTRTVDYMFYAHLFDGIDRMEGVLFQDFENGSLVFTVEAEEAIWRDGQWIFLKGRFFNIMDNERVAGGTFSEYRMPQIERNPQQISLGSKRTREMSMAELQTVISAYREEERDIREYLVYYYQRWSVPLASFIIALLAAPLGIIPVRSGTSAGMGLSVLVIFTYYVLMTVGSALGQSGLLSPFLGAWIQNFFFGALGLVMLYNVDR